MDRIVVCHLGDYQPPETGRVEYGLYSWWLRGGEKSSSRTKLCHVSKETTKVGIAVNLSGDSEFFAPQSQKTTVAKGNIANTLVYGLVRRVLYQVPWYEVRGWTGFSKPAALLQQKQGPTVKHSCAIIKQY